MLFVKEKSEKDIMFDMERIGRNLMVARKNAGMTQMELADRMGISFQAVSNWERGVSCPDISKLAELSELLGVTIDSLLGNERAAELVRKVEQEVPVLTPQEFESVAPLLNQEQADRAAERTDWNIEEMLLALPFLSEDFLCRVAREKYEETGRLESVNLLFPFLREDDLHSLALDTFRRESALEAITPALPFLAECHLLEMTMELYRRKGRLEDIILALPFLGEEDVAAIAKEHFRKTASLESLKDLFPFMSSKALEELVLQAMKK